MKRQKINCKKVKTQKMPIQINKKTILIRKNKIKNENGPMKKHAQVNFMKARHQAITLMKNFHENQINAGRQATGNRVAKKS